MFQRTILDSGLRVLTSPMPHTRSVSISIYLGAGSRYETEAEAGVSHFLEHLLFKGTERRPSPQAVSETIDRVGGLLNAATDREMTVYWCKVAKPHFPLALDLLVDMLRHSLFVAEELERERGIVLDELAMSDDSPQQRVGALLDALRWPDQPLGRDVAGTRESVAGLRREAVLDYLGRQYVPNNAVISIAGDVEHTEVLERVALALEDWEMGAPSPWIPAHDEQQEPRVAVEYRKTEQANLLLSLPGLPSFHPDRFALDLLNVILGEGMSSRLFLEARERRGLAYDVGSEVGHLQDVGSLVVYAGVQPKQAAAMVKCAFEVLEGLPEGVSEEEVERARELSKGRLLLRMEDSRAVSGWLGAQELLLDRVRTVDEVVEIVDGITMADLRRVAAEVLDWRRLCLAVVGPFRGQARFQALVKR